MNEAKRIVRYVTPGLVFIIECVALLFVLRPDWTATTISTLGRDAGFLGLFASLLASGGVGAILGAWHHRLHWMGCCGGMDHRESIRRLVRANILQLLRSS
jgi:hypothetical protein